jgi:hypothetical protein
MERICYSPTKDDLPEAEKLANAWGCEVQTGDSQRTTALEFDRDKVQILQIPTEQYLNVSHGEIHVNQTIQIKYVDEFTLVDSIRLEYTLRGITKEVSPLYVSPPHLRDYRIRFAAPGTCDIRLFDDDGTIATEQVKVLPWQ